ncbi:MAG TPA: cytochrome c, partial [Thermomicrobiales bacterium]|nr:cytochrome c [Thermomicrobiales bacterium]
LVVMACAGVDDSGTSIDTLATFEARQNQPTPAMPTRDPDAGPPDPADLAATGQQLFSTMGCQGCHSVDGSASAGPTWQGLWMSDVPLADGSTVIADEQYITTAVLDPGAQIRDGFQNIMPSFEGRIDEAQIAAIIEFIKTLE